MCYRLDVVLFRPFYSELQSLNFGRLSKGDIKEEEGLHYLGAHPHCIGMALTFLYDIL